MKIKILVLLVSIVMFVSCSKDEDSNPVTNDPAYVGVYEGTTSSGKEASVTISNVDGKAYVTKYSITYTYLFGSSTATATKSQSSTSGLAELSGSSFSISLGTDVNEKLIGTFASSTSLTGVFSFDTGLTSNGTKIYGAGTFTLTKK